MIKNLTLLSTLLAAAWLAGCANPGALPPPAQPLSASQIGLATEGQLPALDERWWHAWGDSRLEALVDKALADHPSLQAAQARRARAAAGAETARANDDLQVNLSADVTRQRYTKNGMIPPPIAGNTWDSANLMLGAAWEFDFFGRHRAALAAAVGAERAAQADAAAARTWLATQVVRSYVALARLVAQRRIAERVLAQREDTLALIRQRVGAGLDTQVELQQGLGAVPDAKLQLGLLDEQISLAQHQLASLTLQPPQALQDLAPELPSAVVPLPAQLSADLLGRRADLVAARWRVEAATQDVAVARSQFYPNLSLSAFAGLSSLGLDRLVDMGSRTYGAGPALHLPIFDAGRLRAQLHGRAADLDGAVAAYNAALLDAVQSAADAQTSLQALQQQRQEQAAAHSHAQLAFEHAQQRYRAGLGSYLLVLSAETQVLTQQRAAVDLQARQLDAQAQLARALGGGWQPEPASASAQ
jgi:NodT family efflux transporter outer membrane factor (OMF) lipoprotein